MTTKWLKDTWLTNEDNVNNQSTYHSYWHAWVSEDKDYCIHETLTIGKHMCIQSFTMARALGVGRYEICLSNRI